MGLLVTLLWVGQAWSDDPLWKELRGLPVVHVDIVAEEVFDTDRPDENNALYRAVNAIHIRTRESVIRRELLLRQGDVFDPLLAAETERNLRGLGIFQDARVHVRRVADGVVLEVHTADRWSLRLVTDISKQGDIYRVRLGLQNINFLGRGSLFGASVVASNDVDAFSLFVGERRIFDTRWNGVFGYASDDLVVVNEARLQRPYFSELVNWTSNLHFLSIRGERRAFFDGAVADTLDLDETTAEAVGAGYRHGETRSRLGVLYTRRGLSRDLSANQAALGVLWGAMQRRFRHTVEVDLYGTREDIASGWSVQIGAGADLKALGADRNRPMWRADATAASFLGEDGLLGVQVRHHGFEQDGVIANGRFEADVYGFWKAPKAGTLTWNLGFQALLREPEHLRLLLGGDNHLRGYPARFDTGTRALWFNVEQRLFTPVQLLFFGFGAVLFLDAGQAWEAGETLALARTHVGGGAGLRIGNRKSGSSIVRIDLAFGRGSFELSLASSSFFRAARDFEFPETTFYR